MQQQTQTLLDHIKTAIASDQLALPSLPDIALQLTKECKSDQASANSLANIISTDPGITAQLIHICNSPIYRTRTVIEDLHMAIARLGLRKVKDLVVSIAMKQLYQASTDVLQERFRELWLASTKTAALCRLLADDYDFINTEQAMLTGLLHNIGALPLLVMINDEPDLIDDAPAVDSLMRSLQGEIGCRIFKAWHFPEHMMQAAAHCYDFDRQHPEPVDYVDIVQVALVEGSIFTGLDCPTDWNSIPAFKQLNINTESNILDIEGNKLIFDETEAYFNL